MGTEEVNLTEVVEILGLERSKEHSVTVGLKDCSNTTLPSLNRIRIRWQEDL